MALLYGQHIFNYQDASVVNISAYAYSLFKDYGYTLTSNVLTYPNGKFRFAAQNSSYDFHIKHVSTGWIVGNRKVGLQNYNYGYKTILTSTDQKMIFNYCINTETQESIMQVISNATIDSESSYSQAFVWSYLKCGDEYVIVSDDLVCADRNNSYSTITDGIGTLIKPINTTSNTKFTSALMIDALRTDNDTKGIFVPFDNFKLNLISTCRSEPVVIESADSKYLVCPSGSRIGTVGYVLKE